MGIRSFRLPSNTSGMTLIEVMIALLIFTVGMLAVAALQATSLKSIASARQGMYNSVTAGGKLEQILSMAYDDQRLADRDRGYDPVNPDHGPFAIAESGGTVEWEVHDNFPAPFLKRITVTIRWPDRGGASKSFSYEYVKTKDLS